MTLELREYQVETIEKVRDLIRRGFRRILVVAPTGAGKTIVASKIIHSGVERGSRALFLAHRKELIHQTSDKLTRFEVPHGIMLPGHREALHRPVQVASVQTLARRPGRISQVDIVCVDEAHHCTNENTYSKLLYWYRNAIILGFTATPWRLDGKGLGDVFDAHVLARAPRQLRDDGWLVPVGGWEYDTIDTRGARIAGGDFVGKSLEPAVMGKKLFGHIIQEWKQHAGNARTVLFGCTIDHSYAMARAFREAGVPAEHVDSKTPDGERAAILQRLRSGETRVLCNVNVVTEGFDLPELECCILARPTLSTALYLQMVGRVLRPAEGKTMARIHDHARCLAMHGHPYAERDYSPEKSARVTKGAYDGGDAAPRRRCPECESFVEQWPCDACGHQPGPAEIEAELQAQRTAIESDGAARLGSQLAKQLAMRAKWALKSEEEKREFFARMVAKHGPRRALHVYRWASGETEWPPRAWRVGLAS